MLAGVLDTDCRPPRPCPSHRSPARRQNPSTCC